MVHGDDLDCVLVFRVKQAQHAFTRYRSKTGKMLPDFFNHETHELHEQEREQTI